MLRATRVLVSLLPLVVCACASLYGVTDVPDGGGDTGSGGDSAVDARDGTTPTKDGGSEDHHAPDAHDAMSSDGGHPIDAGHEGGSGDAIADAAHDAHLDSLSPTLLSVTPTTLSFGDAGGTAGFVACGGTTPDPLTFTVRNPGTTPIKWWAAFGLGTASPYAQSQATCTQAAPCTIAPGTSVDVTVTAPKVAADAGITTFNDTITVFANTPGDGGQQGAPVGQVALQEASYGAILTFSPTDVNFGEQPSSGTYTQSVQILNAGNAPVNGATLGLNGSSEEFSISTGTADFEIPLSGVSVNAIFTPGGGTAPVTGTVELTVPPESTCASLPADLTLEGQGTSALISVTASINFNAEPKSNGGIGVSCGTTALTQNAVVTNKGSGAAMITALSLGLGASSPFTLSSPALPIAVAAGASVNVSVVPNEVPTTAAPGANLGDTLAITVDGTTYDVALEQTAAGAVLSLATTTIAFSSTPTGQKGTYGQVLTNSGNVAAPVTFSASNGVFTFGTNVVALADANTSVNAYFSPTAASSYTSSGSLVVAGGTPLCAGSSGTIPLQLSGMGTSSNTYAVAPNSIAFGANTCGSLPPAAQTVTITNNAGLFGGTTWTAMLSGTNASLFSLSAASGSVNAFGGTATFTVAPVTLASSSHLTTNEVAYGVDAIVTVVVGTGTGAETFTIPVSEMPSGVCGQ